MTTQRALRSLVLLAALALGSLPAPSAHADATTPAPALCFDHDPTVPAPQVPTDPTKTPGTPNTPTGKECPGGVPDAPNYMEVASPRSVNISIQNFPPKQSLQIKVSCNNPQGSNVCHEFADDSYVYYATLSDQKWWAWFPEDFHDAPGRDARTDHAGRYNSSWTASAVVGGQELARAFNLWLLDSFTSDNGTVASGEHHIFQAGGFEPNTAVQFLVQRRVATGPNGETTFVPVSLDPAPPGRADFDGRYFYEWNVPLDEVTRAQQCPNGHANDCYQIVMRGTNTSKAEEDVFFRVGAANLRARVLQGPAAGTTPQLERTQNASIALDLRYPGGDHANGPPFVPADLPAGPGGAPRSLRVAVVRNASRTPGTPLGPVVVGEIPLTYVPNHFRWEATWTVPRDLDLPPGADFTLRLVEALDVWGNHVKQQDVATYTVKAASLAPVFVDNITQLPRTELGRFVLSISYHNGTPFTDRDNTTALTGCYVPDSGTGTNVCGTAPKVPGAYANGTWSFPIRYNRTDTLQNYAFVLNGGTTDAWNNSVASVGSDAFALVPASPHVDFRTVMRGTSAQTLERGERIGLEAIIQYGDGKAFNASVRDTHNPTGDWANHLNVTVTKRGSDGSIQAVDIIPLDLVDDQQGLWIGSLDLSLDAQFTPAGRWTFALVANDSAQNINRTEFNRTIIPTPIRFEERKTSPLLPEAGTTKVISVFQLYYPTLPNQQPQVVPPDAIQHTLVAQVYHWDAKDRTTVGDAVSGPIQPKYDSDTQLWTLEYLVPGTLFNGTYVLAVRGVDTSGNPIQGDAWTRAFTPQSPVRDRQITAQPQPVVERGDAATVLVAERDGDVGPDGTGDPIIRVERWNGDGQRWEPVAGASQVRQPSDLNGHFGVYPITTTTPIGIYRFVFVAREAAPGYAFVTNASTNFTVQPTSVTRGILDAPPASAVKGDSVSFAVERQDGDRIDSVTLLLNGRPSGMPGPILIVEGDHFNATWRIPFEAPNGNYTVHIEGRDLFGNDITVDVPSIEAVAAQLAGKIVGNPPRVVARGTSAQLIFGITYPSGLFYTAATSLPSVVVYNDTDVVATATVAKQDATYLANWTPPASAPIGDYWFEVNGQGIGGNSFPPLRSTTFRLAPGTFERQGGNQVSIGTERLNTNVYDVPLDPADKFVSFELGYYGVTADTLAIQGKDPISLSPLPHLVQDTLGRYEARFVTDQQTPIGAYRVFMKGEDGLGNTITSASNIFLVKPTTVVITWDQQPPNDAFKEGKTLTVSFAAKYKTGPVLTDALGHPSVALLLGNAPTNVKPDVSFDPQTNRWVVTIQLPGILTDGDYSFAVGGQDLAGNSIANSRSIPYTVSTSLPNSFAKVVPGPEPILGVLAVAGAALALAATKRRPRA